jgi:hypothetical protein
MNPSERHLKNHNSRGRPGILLWMLPYLLFATCGELFHSPSCPDRLILKWLGQAAHHAQASAPRQGAAGSDSDECPACLWAGHARGQAVAPLALPLHARVCGHLFSRHRGVAGRFQPVTLGSRGPPSFLV